MNYMPNQAVDALQSTLRKPPQLELPPVPTYRQVRPARSSPSLKTSRIFPQQALLDHSDFMDDMRRVRSPSYHRREEIPAVHSRDNRSRTPSPHPAPNAHTPKAYPNPDNTRAASPALGRPTGFPSRPLTLSVPLHESCLEASRS